MADNDVLIVIETVKEALKSSGKDIQHMDSSTIFRALTSTNSGIEFTVTPQNEVGSQCTSNVYRSHSTLSTISMDSYSDMMNNAPPKSQALSEDVSFKALKKVLECTASERSEESDRQKMKQNFFVEGDFDEICDLIRKETPRPSLNEHLSLLFKNINENQENQKIKPNDSEYFVMKDKEPHMNFFPRLFM